MPSIKIPRSEMLELLDDSSSIVRSRITGNGRWSIHHEIIFKRDGKLYQSNYSVGATESQDESPYEYAPDPVECPEVQEVPAIDYKPIVGN